MESNQEVEAPEALMALLRGDPRLTNFLLVILLLCQTGLV